MFELKPSVLFSIHGMAWCLKAKEENTVPVIWMCFEYEGKNVPSNAVAFANFSAVIMMGLLFTIFVLKKVV